MEIVRGFVSFGIATATLWSAFPAAAQNADRGRPEQYVKLCAACREAAIKPTPAGTKTCPAVRGAINWYSTAYNPITKFFYVMAVEDCNIYRQSDRGGYVPSPDPSNPPEKYLRTIEIETGKIVWEVPQAGAPEGITPAFS